MRSIWPWLEEAGPCILALQAERACELRNAEMLEPANIHSLNWWQKKYLWPWVTFRLVRDVEDSAHG